MHLLNLYILHDKKAKVLVGPVIADKSAVPAIRELTNAVNADKGMVANHPEDFQLLHIGMLDQETGGLHHLDGNPTENDVEIVTQAIALKRA